MAAARSPGRFAAGATPTRDPMAMQTIYQPGLASENCLLVPAGMFLLLTALGIGLPLFIRAMVPDRMRNRRQLVYVLAGAPVLAAAAVAALVVSGSESVVRLATDGTVLEYRYCRTLALHVETYPRAAIRGSRYRQERDYPRRGGRVRIRHYALLHVDGRAEPIRFMLDPDGSTLDFALLDRIAPDALRGYRAATGR